MTPLNCDQDLPGALDFLKQLVAVNSFTENPTGVNAVGSLIAEAFRPMGFSATRVPARCAEFGDHWFLATEFNPALPTVALVSHLDTVYTEDEERRNNFSWREVGDRIYGPGINDIKGGTALAWMLLTAMQREMPGVVAEANWVIVLNACEEVDSADFAAACTKMLPTGTACLIFEADGGTCGDFKIVRQRKGRATFEVRVTGRGAHAGARHPQGANAVVEVARVVGDLAAITDHDAGITVNVGSVRGGTVNNRVPHEAVANLEMRAWSGERYASAMEAILGLSGEGVARSSDGFACSIDIRVVDETPPWPENKGTQQLVDIWLAAGRQLGVQIDSQSRGGLSDGNLLWHQFPTLDGLGPCGEFSHCSEQSADGTKEQEWVDAASFVPKVRLNAAAISALIQNHSLNP